jgi:dipeptidyl-peptidase-4
MSFPAGKNEFLWISDRDGWQHIYRYDYAGKLLNQVTGGRWSVTRIEGTDAQRGLIYYTSTEASPLERQLYVIGFDGKGRRRLTTTAGTHSIDMSPDTRYYLDRWSNVGQPRQVELWATGGRMLKKLEDNARVTEWLAGHAYSAPELFTFTTSDSARIDASVIKPWPFDSTRRYPMVFAIYGGPGSQQVYNSFNGSAYAQWLAQQGYLVVGVNNRGTNNYGSAFMKTAYKRLGYWEAHDFAETARYLATRSWADGSRVAIVGTSYGGYATVYTMEMYPDLFTVGVANSPVTDWRLYDTIYTERYMGLLSDNAAGYDSSSAIKHAGQIKGHLLLVHSMMDDNVHPQNTMQLLTALTDARIDAELRIYPPGRHGAAYNGQSALLISQATTDFLARHLKGAASGTASGGH